MNPQQFKPALIRDKEFLREIYSSTSLPHSKRLLMFCSDQQLDTILRLMHFIATGQMPLKKTHFDSFSTSLVRFLRSNFEKKAAFLRLLKTDRKNKVKVVQKLLQLMPQLLYPLFNRSQ